jgi:leucyl/phenylalanyl-tRNA--protein transferase
MDAAFEPVIRACARTRQEQGEGTWIVDEMITAFVKLHRAGYAHSVETWQEDRLVGGLYGVSLGKAFFGESMFSISSNASSVALVTLVRFLQALEFDFVDCQVTTAHLMRFGAREVPRARFLKQLRKALTTPSLKGRWDLCFTRGDRASPPVDIAADEI